jgi:LuxR family maltose regulon positive regulatory protein
MRPSAPDPDMPPAGARGLETGRGVARIGAVPPDHVDRDGARALCLEEGRAALNRGAWESAREAFEAALRESETPDALEGLGWALFWLDRTEEALDLRERAFRLYREQGDQRAAARMAYGLAVDCIDLRGEAPASGWLERARRLLEGTEPGPEHGWLALWEGHFALLYRRDTDTARERGQVALDLGRRQGLLDLEMLARALEGLVLVAEGAVQEGMRRLDEATAAALAGEMAALDAVGATCCFLVHACERVRDYDRAAQWGERVDRFAREWGITPALTVCRTQHAAMLIGQGDWARAEEELQQAIARLSGSRPLLAVDGLEQLAELRRRQGRWDEAEELFARVESRSLSLLGRGAIALDRGDATTAADLLERFLRRTPPDNWNGRASALELLVRAHLALGHRGEAEEAAGALRGLLERVDTPTIRAAARTVPAMRRVGAWRTPWTCSFRRRHPSRRPARVWTWPGAWPGSTARGRPGRRPAPPSSASRSSGRRVRPSGPRRS